MKATGQYFFCGAVYNALQGAGSNFDLVIKSLSVTIKINVIVEHFLVSFV